MTEAGNRKLGLWALIREDLAAHGGDWTLPGFRAVAVHRFGAWCMGLESKILRAPVNVLYRVLYRRCRNVYGIELPYTVDLGRRVVFEHQGSIVIHGGSVIGDHTIIRQGVTLGNRHLDRPGDAPRIGKRVNIGAGAKILGSVTVADNATIGANAVVLHDVTARATVVGIPAMPIGEARPAGRNLSSAAAGGVR